MCNFSGEVAHVFDGPDAVELRLQGLETFLINGGLDVGYISAGIYLNARGHNHDNAQLKGYGTSVIMQGFFLLLFDGTMYKLHRTNGNKFSRFPDDFGVQSSLVGQ